MYRRHFNALVKAWNTGEFDELEQCVHNEIVRHGPASMKSSANSIADLKNLITGFRTAFPDLHLVLDEEIYQQGRSTIRWTFMGTNTGPGEFGPTGKFVKIQGASIAHFKDDKIMEEYVFYDTADFFAQLGLTDLSIAATG
ncbi:MAG: ester cyclase [Acidobacteriota bacterium]|nr:ester cyclase [Acidobacteriota bacterium]MDH3528308.1 ester cyclase [Acidobacteriota bacterium]